MEAKQCAFDKREKLLPRNRYTNLSFSDIESNDGEDGAAPFYSYKYLSGKVRSFAKKVRDVTSKAWQMGVSDPRKIVFSAKMGLALMLISLLIFLNEPGPDLSQHSIWAILTVVVVFEFSIGATLSKGFNRGLGTLSAGGLALGIAELSRLLGDWEEVCIIITIFFMGFCATYAKLYPTLKPYEYGFRVFLLTYCYITVYGYRTGEFLQTAVSRFLLIALGAAVCLAVNICIWPIWAGEDLHRLVVKNFMNVASSLEGSVDGYLCCVEYEKIPSKILTYQADDDPVYSGYRSAVQSYSEEDSLMSFAIWEPPHGPYRSFRYPWKNYSILSGALRHCAFMVMALHGCILSEIQAPEELRQVFHQELQRVGTEGAKVLRELGNKVKRMEKLGPINVLHEVHKAAEELQNKIDKKSYLLVDAESWEIGKCHKELSEPQEVLTLDDDERENQVVGIVEHEKPVVQHENQVLPYKSLSENILDFRSVDITKVLEATNNLTSDFKPQRGSFGKLPSWPRRTSSSNDPAPHHGASKTYERASALSLATFVSLLIEFVARLQNVVDAFEELSKRANFKEPVMETEGPGAGEPVRFWTRLRRCFRCFGLDAPKN